LRQLFRIVAIGMLLALTLPGLAAAQSSPPVQPGIVGVSTVSTQHVTGTLHTLAPQAGRIDVVAVQSGLQPAKDSTKGYNGGDIMATIIGGMALAALLFIIVVLVRRRSVR
jgi:hypothetical protein